MVIFQFATINHRRVTTENGDLVQNLMGFYGIKNTENHFPWRIINMGGFRKNGYPQIIYLSFSAEQKPSSYCGTPSMEASHIPWLLFAPRDVREPGTTRSPVQCRKTGAGPLLLMDAGWSQDTFP